MTLKIVNKEFFPDRESFDVCRLTIQDGDDKQVFTFSKKKVKEGRWKRAVNKYFDKEINQEII